MHYLLTGVAVLVILVGVVASRSASTGSDNGVVQNDEPAQEISSEVKGVQEIETSTVTPTTAQSPTPSPAPTKVVADDTYGQYQYPGSVIINSSGQTMELSSSDNPDTITDWYKQRIKDEGMGVTSFVTTKTNGNVLNKLAGADGSFEIEVEIKKVPSGSVVRIIISFLNS